MEAKPKIFDATKYRGLWVAFKPDTDTVVGAGRLLKDVIQEVREKGIDDPEFYHVPASDAYRV